ncbi:MAG: DUF4390 domain-containing protein [bacterium]|jgi:hypothetical protein
MLRSCCALLLLAAVALTCTTPAYAAEPALNISGIYAVEDSVCIDFQLRDAVTAEIMNQVRDGVPLEIIFKIEVWRESFWFDRTIATSTISCIFRYDNWDTVYCVTKAHEGVALREPIRSGSIGEILHKTCVYTEHKICEVVKIRPDKNYFVVVRSEIRSLSAERVREIESWLSGKDRHEDEGGGLLDLMASALGRESRSVESTKQYFSLPSITH